MNGPGSVAVARGLDLLATITKGEERSLANVYLALELVFFLFLFHFSYGNSHIMEILGHIAMLCYQGFADNLHIMTMQLLMFKI